jgi:hypothetical protein
VPACVENRELYIIDDDYDEGNDNQQSDLVRKALNLGYLSKLDQDKFDFKVGKRLLSDSLV